MHRLGSIPDLSAHSSMSAQSNTSMSEDNLGFTKNQKKPLASIKEADLEMTQPGDLGIIRIESWISVYVRGPETDWFKINVDQFGPFE